MQSRRKTLSKKVVSIFMAFIFLALSAPVAFAAEPVALTTSNVTEWPTAVYKDGEKLYFGQKDGDVVSWSGGTVNYNGIVVPGHFEFIDPNVIQTSTGNKRANIKFIPDDTTLYSGFESNRSRNATYEVSPTTPVYVDEVNDPVIASKVDAGSKLSDSILSGGKMINPYYAEEPKIAAREWGWENPDLIVTESGYYTATFVPAGYNKTTAQVYVELNKTVIYTSVSEAPSIDDFTYNGKQTWSEIALNGGVAVEEGTTNIVEGRFEVSDLWKNREVSAGTHNIAINFIPNDTENYLGSECTVTVTIGQKAISFVDAEGNIIVDEFVFEVEPNEKMSSVEALIKPYLMVPDNSVISVEDRNGTAQNNREYKLRVIHDNPNYSGSELYFTVKFKTKELGKDEIRFFRSGAGKWTVDCGEYSPPGVFEIYAKSGESEEIKIGEVKSNQTLEWNPTASGDYTFRVEYKAAEEDYFTVKEVTTYPLEYYPDRYFAATGTQSTPYKMGATVTVKAPATDIAQPEKPYYGFIGWEVVSGNPELSDEQLASAEFSFAMPDENVELKANYKFSHELYFKFVWQQIADFFNFLSNVIKELFSI